MSKIPEPGTVRWRNYLLSEAFSITGRKGSARIFGCFFCGVCKVEKRDVGERVCPSCGRAMSPVLTVSTP